MRVFQFYTIKNWCSSGCKRNTHVTKIKWKSLIATHIYTHTAKRAHFDTHTHTHLGKCEIFVSQLYVSVVHAYVCESFGTIFQLLHQLTAHFLRMVKSESNEIFKILSEHTMNALRSDCFIFSLFDASFWACSQNQQKKKCSKTIEMCGIDLFAQ